MEKHQDRLLRAEALNFFGAVMAGQSHEATNVLNIINELAGLQRDILLLAEQGRSIDAAKLMKVALKIQDQVKRGETIIRCMNRFAHSVDCPVTVFDLREALEQIAYLAKRAANLTETRLDHDFPEKSMSVETSPFGLKQAVFYCIQIALKAAGEKRHVTVSYDVGQGGAEIAINSADPLASQLSEPAKRDFLSLLMKELGGKLVAPPGDDDAHRIVLFFPRPAAASGVVDNATQDCDGG